MIRRIHWPIMVTHSPDTSRPHDMNPQCWCKPTAKRVLPRPLRRTR